MRLQTSTRPFTVLGLAFAGALAGHAITYAWLVPQAAQRASVLHATGHAYLAQVDGLAMVVGFISLAVVFLRRLMSPSGREVSFASLVGRIASFQVLAFATMEVTERVRVSGSLSDLARILPAGTLVEIAVALVVATVLRVVLRAASVAAETIVTGSVPPPRAALVPLALPIADLPQAVQVARWESRAPPPPVGL